MDDTKHDPKDNSQDEYPDDFYTSDYTDNLTDESPFTDTVDEVEHKTTYNKKHSKKLSASTSLTSSTSHTATSTILPTPSDEQQAVIDQIQLGNNVIVDSVAGSGKTTTNLLIAHQCPNERILLLTYNARLKEETRSKVVKCGIGNLEVHNYHAFCVNYYDDKAHTDAKIKELIDSDKKKKSKKEEDNIPYSLIIIDEAQDISDLYYALICKIYRDNELLRNKGSSSSQPARLCIVGDKWQSIYDFNGADSRYIEYADRLFNFNPCPWVRRKLSVSFRVTKEIADFVNHCLLCEDRIDSNKVSGVKPKYVICDTFEPRHTFRILESYLNEGYAPSDIFILAASIGKKDARKLDRYSANTIKEKLPPVQELENYIKTNRHDIPIYASSNTGEKITDEMISGKLLISTFHQTKGLERKVVIVFGFDSSYFKYYGKEYSKDVCPNTIYVAATRASERLVLLHNRLNKSFDFINMNSVEEFCVKTGTEIVRTESTYIETFVRDMSVSNIVKFMPMSAIVEFFSELEIITLTSAQFNITLEHITPGDTVEQVADINGIAIPAHFEQITTGELVFPSYIRETAEHIYEIGEKGYNVPLTHPWKPWMGYVIHNECWVKKFKSEEKKMKSINTRNMTTPELLYMCNWWSSIQSGYLFKLYQIRSYNWLSSRVLNACMDSFRTLGIDPSAGFEYGLQDTVGDLGVLDSKLKEIMHPISNIVGFIDCIDEVNNCVYEFKCTKELIPEHYVQLALYMFLNESDKRRGEDPMLHNRIRILRRICKLHDDTYNMLLDMKKRSKVLTSTHRSKCISIINQITNILSRILNILRDSNRIESPVSESVSSSESTSTSTQTESQAPFNMAVSAQPSTSTLVSDTSTPIQLSTLPISVTTIPATTPSTISYTTSSTTSSASSPDIKTPASETKYILYNVLTGEKKQIRCDFEKLRGMVSRLLWYRYRSVSRKTDEQFMEDNAKIRNGNHLVDYIHTSQDNSNKKRKSKRK